MSKTKPKRKSKGALHSWWEFFASGAREPTLYDVVIALGKADILLKRARDLRKTYDDHDLKMHKIDNLIKICNTTPKHTPAYKWARFKLDRLLKP